MTRPPVSVIIPVWNRLEFTQHCLAALAAHTPYDLYEVIVVDNGSTDGTRGFLATLEGDVTVIANPVNLGFARACNQGARAARGRYLLFLNNDTAPQPGWLEALLEAAARDPRIAVVGAKLLYPDDTIQHAGVALLRDSPYPISPVHLHRLKPRDFAAADEEREVAAVTGACMLIRADVFREVGGFDEAYLNGYEDVDLCLQVRDRGYRVVYTPKSVVYHHESATPGRHARERENLSYLHVKWLGRLPPGVLAEDAPAPEEAMAADDGAGRGAASVVVVTYNSLPTIAPCLRSLVRTLAPADEAIVVDNASRDGTREYLGRVVSAWDRFRVLLNDRNLGFSRACNQGLGLARGDLIVFLNPDTVVPPRWLSRLAAHLSDPGVGAVGPLSDRVAGLQKHELYLGGLVLPPGAPVGEVAEALYRQNGGGSVEARMLIGFCLMVPRRVLEEVGPLDEDLFLGHEDLELSWRLSRRGYRLLVATDVFVRHHGHVSFRSDPEAKTGYLTRQSANILAAKLSEAYAPGPVPPPEELWGMSWFQPCRALASVVIPCAKGEPQWRPTVERLVQHTPQPVEIILCGQGAPTEEPAWLGRLVARRGTPVILRPGGDTFAAACNRGSAAARGDHLVLLAEGALVTRHWLARLQAAVHGTGAGAVAAVSRPVADAELPDPDGWAAAHFLEHAGELGEAPGTTSPCLLITRAAWQAAGGLDETRPSRTDALADLFLRLRQAGFGVLSCEDVLIPCLETPEDGPATGPQNNGGTSR